MVEGVVEHARFWNLIDEEFAYDLNRWLMESEFFGNVPEEIKSEYESRYSVDPDSANSHSPEKPNSYPYEQYFIYTEICKALGVDPGVEDTE